jgi:hypothetical protein
LSEFADFQQYLAYQFSFHIFQFGDEEPAKRLIALVQGWAHASRPAAADIRIRAFQNNSTVRPEIQTTGEFEVKRRYTTFVIDWPK